MRNKLRLKAHTPEGESGNIIWREFLADWDFFNQSEESIFSLKHQAWTFWPIISHDVSLGLIAIHIVKSWPNSWKRTFQRCLCITFDVEIYPITFILTAYNLKAPDVSLVSRLYNFE